MPMSDDEDEPKPVAARLPPCACGAPAKYRCPGCACCSCSLSCVKRHKEDKGCDGKRQAAERSAAALQREREYIDWLSTRDAPEGDGQLDDSWRTFTWPSGERGRRRFACKRSTSCDGEQRQGVGAASGPPPIVACAELPTTVAVAEGGEAEAAPAARTRACCGAWSACRSSQSRTA